MRKKSGGRYMGVDLFSDFPVTSNSGTMISVTFNQDGAPPTVAPYGVKAP